ncbi:MAG TPA: tetratricopeptide repeat protein [bacterium]|nr:tetratricopeptide repeat protein [bacterium]
MYQFALRLYEDGQYELAAKQLAQLMEQFPSGQFMPDAVFLAGNAQENLGKFREATRYLQQYVTEFTDGARLCEAMILLGTNQQRMGHYTDAEGTFKRLLEQKRCDKQFEDATAKLAELLFIQERFEDGIANYAKLFKKGYGSQLGEQLYEHYAESLLSVSRLDESRRAFRTLRKKVKSDQARARALFNLAVTDYLSSDFKESEKLFSSLVSDFPTAEQATASSLGVIWSVYKQEDYQRAADLLGQYQSRKEPELRLATSVVRSWEAAALGDYDLAVSGLRKLLDEGNPPSGEERQHIMGLIGRWLEEKEDHVAAASTYEKMLAMNLGSEARYECRYRLACALVGAKDLGRAEKLFEELIVEEPFGSHIEQCYLMLARAGRIRTDFDEAAKRYKSIVHSFSDSPVAAEASFELGEMLLECGRAIDAVPVLNSLGSRRAGLTPDLAQRSQLALCRSFYAIKAFENCDAAADEFLKDYPNSVWLGEVLMVKGLALSKIGSAKEAVESLEASRNALLKRQPAQDVILGTLLGCRSLGQLGKCSSFISEVRRSFVLGRNLTGILGFWDCYLKKERGNARKAAECFKELAREMDDPQLASLCYVQACQCSAAEGRPGDAAGCAEALRSLDVGWPFATVAEELVRKAFMQEGSFAKSVVSIAEFREHEPGAFLGVEQTFKRAEVAFSEGKLGKACRLLSKQIGINPQSKLLYASRLLLARACMARKKLGAAEDALSPVVSDQAAAPRLKQESLALLGDIWFQRDKPRQAVECYKRLNHPVRENRRDEALLLFRVGQAYRRLGDSDLAIDYYGLLVTEYGDVKGLCEELVAVGDNLRKMGKFKLAQSALSIVISDDSCQARYTVEAQFWFAHTLQEQGRFDEAILRYLDLSYSYTQEAAVPWVTSARANVGECYEVKGDFDEAVRVYEKIIEKYPGSLWSKQARARIDRIKERSRQSVQESGK